MLRKFTMQDAPTFYPVVPRDSEMSRTFSQSPVEKSSRPIGPKGFHFTSIMDYSEAYRSGKTNPIAVAETILHAIATSDGGMKPLRAFVQINEEEVKRMAAEAAKRFEEGNALSVFDGIPVGVKEQILVKSYHLRSGTVFLGNNASTRDATLVNRLRSAGAVIIGITNMHELALGTLGNNPNRLHGTARNPYDPNRYTGGSSSGSAAAVAAGVWNECYLFKVP
jgi:Asp-tRNA(Asn)/Glu-tRNA(Gln) amidotransferase A subunit family amidase